MVNKENFEEIIEKTISIEENNDVAKMVVEHTKRLSENERKEWEKNFYKHKIEFPDGTYIESKNIERIYFLCKEEYVGVSKDGKPLYILKESELQKSLDLGVILPETEYSELTVSNNIEIHRI